MSSTSRSASAVHAAVSHQLKAEAKATGRPHNELLREFTYQRFLGRVFSEPDSPWILKGGTGLLVRLPGARYSQDIDLLHTAAGLDDALLELAGLGGVHPMDPFFFALQPTARMIREVDGAKVKVAASVGVKVFCQFSIDVSTSLTLISAVEHQKPRLVIDVPELQALPSFTLFPLPDQVADKVCAMYERHGDRGVPSSRYRAGRRRDGHCDGIGEQPSEIRSANWTRDAWARLAGWLPSNGAQDEPTE